MRYVPSQPLYGLAIVAAFVGCGKDMQQTNVSVNNSGLERTVLAEQVTSANTKNSQRIPELDLSTPEKTLDRYKKALELRNVDLIYDLCATDKKKGRGQEDPFQREINKFTDIGNYKITKKEANKVTAEIRIKGRAAEGEPIEESDCDIKLELINGQWKITYP